MPRELPPFPLSDEWIVADCVASLTPDEVEYWLAMDEREVVGLHFLWGLQIRNEYKLWDPDNSVELFDDPDDRSMRILERVWKAVRENHTPLTEEQRQLARAARGIDDPQ